MPNIKSGNDGRSLMSSAAEHPRRLDLRTLQAYAHSNAQFILFNAHSNAQFILFNASNDVYIMQTIPRLQQ